jgi:hypothetical protein
LEYCCHQECKLEVLDSDIAKAPQKSASVAD